MAKQITAADGSSLPLREYKRPQRTVRTFVVYVSGKKVECVTTKGERYTYLHLDGTDYYTDGLLTDGGKYKVSDIKEQAAA